MSTTPWQAEHPVDAALAARLAHEQFPETAGHAPVWGGSGWDIDVWRFGPLAVRFPRRTLGVGALEIELRTLPVVAPRVPLPVPRPLHVGVPAHGFPARFYAHAWLPGVPLMRAGLDDAALGALATPLGAQLRALHAIAPDALRAAGGVDDPRGDIARVAQRGRDWLARLDIDPAAAALLSAPLPPHDLPPTVIHGDHHAGNLLVDGGALSAVIDWGDCGLGDPAVDLAIAWSLPPDSRETFRAAYGPITAATWARARINAISRHGAALVAQGEGQADAAIAAFARRTIALALAGPA